MLRIGYLRRFRFMFSEIKQAPTDIGDSIIQVDVPKTGVENIIQQVTTTQKQNPILISENQFKLKMENYEKKLLEMKQQI